MPTQQSPPQLFDIQPIPYFPAAPGLVWWIAALVLIVGAALLLRRTGRNRVTLSDTRSVIQSAREALGLASENEARTHLARVCAHLRREGELHSTIQDGLLALDNARYSPLVDRNAAIQILSHIDQTLKRASDPEFKTAGGTP